MGGRDGSVEDADQPGLFDLDALGEPSGRMYEQQELTCCIGGPPFTGVVNTPRRYSRR